MIQKPPLPSVLGGDRVIQAFPRKVVRHLFSHSQNLLSRRIVATKVMYRIGSSNCGTLYIFRFRSRCTNPSSSTLERDDGSHLSKFGPEFGDHKVSSKEGDAECNEDTEILITVRSEGEDRDTNNLWFFLPSTCDSTRN